MVSVTIAAGALLPLGAALTWRFSWGPVQLAVWVVLCQALLWALLLRGLLRLAAILQVALALIQGLLVALVIGQPGLLPLSLCLGLVSAALILDPPEVGLTLIGAILAIAVMPLLDAIPGAPPLQQGASMALLVGVIGLVVWRGALSSDRTLRSLRQRIEQATMAEGALRESEEYYRLIAEHSSDLIALLDEEGSYLYVSPSYARELGIAPVQLIGTSDGGLVHPDDLPTLDDLWLQIGRRGSAEGAYRLGHADGSWRWFEARLRAAPQGGERFVVLVARDITARRQLEEQLQQAQKMEALGRLAGSVAHDFNNMLVVIGSSAELAATALPDDHEAQEDLAAIMSSSKRATQLTRQLLAFARRQPIAPQVVDLGEVVVAIRPLIERMVGPTVALKLQIAPRLWPALVDINQIEQVLMNMAVNARDAMPDGGSLTIALANDLRDSVYEGPDDEGPRPFVRLEIRDTGVGMSAEVQRRMFEPFFTTKGVGRGTGLGLSTCYGIVTQSGGTISVESAIGKGTAFLILLPSAGNQPRLDKTASGPAALPPAPLSERAVGDPLGPPDGPPGSYARGDRWAQIAPDELDAADADTYVLR